jgi:hypothetical protein
MFNCSSYYLPFISSEIDNFFLPFALRAFKTALPPFVFIRSRKPCLFFFFLTDG